MRLIAKTVYWLALAVLLGAAVLVSAYVRRSHQMDALIASVAAEQQVDARFAVALVQRSSGFDTAMATNGMHGLLALHPEDGQAWSRVTGAPFEVFDLFDPRRNLEIGLWKFSMSQLAWKDEREADVWALADWRAGRANASAWAAQRVHGDHALTSIGDPEVRSFVVDVLAASRRDGLRLRLPGQRP